MDTYTLDMGALQPVTTLMGDQSQVYVPVFAPMVVAGLP